MRNFLRLCAIAPVLAWVPALAEPIEVRTRQVIMSLDSPDVEQVDSLVFKGGLDLSSPDARFGGLSGLDVSQDGQRIVAVGDRGIWFTARLVYNRRGELVDLADAALEQMKGVSGRELTDERDRDAESIARLTDGSYVVGFERRHRLRLYDSVGATPRRMAIPPVLRTSPANGGAEAVTRLSGNELLILSEQLEARPGVAAGWIGSGTDWRAVGLRRHGIYRPVGAATRDDGAVFLLERRFTTVGGIGTRISIVPPGGIVPGAIFEGRELAQLIPPLIADNFEGIAVRRAADGSTLIYLISDDNFHDLQRTYLLLFSLAE